MSGTFKKLIRDCLTEDDNNSYCWARVASALTLLFFCGGAIYEVWTLQSSFKLLDFANGAMQILGGSGALIGAKQITSQKSSTSPPDNGGPDPEK